MVVGVGFLLVAVNEQANYREEIAAWRALGLSEQRIEEHAEWQRETSMLGTFGVGGAIFLWLFTSGGAWVLAKFVWLIVGALFVDHYNAQQRHAARQHRAEQLEDAWLDESEQELRARRFARRAEASRRSATGFTRRRTPPRTP